MPESEDKLEQYLRGMAEESEKERKKRPSWRDNPTIRKKDQIKMNERLIKEMGINPGVRVYLKLIDMFGVVKSVNEKSDVPVRVKRDDGETFPYAIEELEVIKN